jgi:hypothetical protein
MAGYCGSRRAGGAPIYVTNWALFGNPAVVAVDGAGLTAGTDYSFGHVLQYPADETILKGVQSGSLYEVLSGVAKPVAASTPGFTCVDQVAIDNAGGSGVWAHLLAPPVSVTLATTARLSAPSSVKVRKTLKLSGTVSSSAAPGSVTITKTRLVGKKWKSAGSAKVSVSKGKFSYGFKPVYRGRWHFVATYSGGVTGTTTYKSSKSAVKTVKVK